MSACKAYLISLWLAQCAQCVPQWGRTANCSNMLQCRIQCSIDMFIPLISALTHSQQEIHAWSCVLRAGIKQNPFKNLDLSSYDKIMLCCQHLSFDWNVKVDQLWLQISNVSSPCARWQPAWVDVVEIHLSVTNHCPKIGFAAAAQSSEMLWIDMECSNIGAWYSVKICVLPVEAFV